MLMPSLDQTEVSEPPAQAIRKLTNGLTISIIRWVKIREPKRSTRSKLPTFALGLSQRPQGKAKASRARRTRGRLNPSLASAGFFWRKLRKSKGKKHFESLKCMTDMSFKSSNSSPHGLITRAVVSKSEHDACETGGEGSPTCLMPEHAECDANLCQPL